MSKVFSSAVTDVLTQQEFHEFDFKSSCVLSTTAALVASAGTTTTLTIAHAGTGEGQFSNSANSFTLDSVAITSSTVPAPPNTRILIKDQVNVATAGNNSKWNGIYTVGALDGTTLTLKRAADFNHTDEVHAGSFTHVEQGTTQGDSSWALTTDGAITVGTTALAFTNISGIALNSLTGATVNVANDSIAFIDADDSSASKKVSIADFATGVAGTVGTTGLTASSGTLVVSDLHPVGVDGSANQLLTDDGDGTVTSEANLTFDGTDLLVSNSASTKPLVTLNTTNTTTTTSGELKFQKIAGDGVVTTEQLGKISFWGQDDAQDDVLTQFGEITSIITGDLLTAKGRIEFKTATNGESPTTGFRIQGTNVNGRVDAYLGGGAGSLVICNGDVITPKLRMNAVDGVSGYDTSAGGFTVDTTNDRVLVWDANDSDYIKFAQLSTVCFLKGTKITLANGKQRSIEDLTLEDKVLTYNIEGLSKIRNKNYVYKWSTDEMKGVFSESGIKNIWINPTDSYLVINDTLRITGHHLIHFKRENRYYFNFAESLQMGDELLTDNNTYDKVETIEEIKEEQNVYNFEIKKDQTYFAENYLVHHYCKLCSGYADII